MAWWDRDDVWDQRADHGLVLDLSVPAENLHQTGLLAPGGHPIVRRNAFGFGRTDEYVILKGQPE